MAEVDEWELSLPGRPPLTVHDNHWANGERDLVLYKPTVVPEMPAPLSNLHNRLRSTIAEAGGKLRIMVYPTYVDERARPRIRKSLTTAELVSRVGLQPLQDLTARKGVTLEPSAEAPTRRSLNLDPPQDLQKFQHALYFRRKDDETPVLAYVHFRVIPVLHHIGWLPRNGS
ncbi:hypothetical protein [Streptomyces sp. MJP52]|uniref:hypothetical protein n=1 Tax=Streptomyces sp. MJP52 TaxID=2940555 RepID=UPI002475060D|nr:hypothetical protein [Streptomyces sp. MJP52]